MSGAGLARRPCANVSAARRKLKSSGRKGSGAGNKGRSASRKRNAEAPTAAQARRFLRARRENAASQRRKRPESKCGKANAVTIATAPRPDSMSNRVKLLLFWTLGLIMVLDDCEPRSRSCSFRGGVGTMRIGKRCGWGRMVRPTWNLLGVAWGGRVNGYYEVSGTPHEQRGSVTPLSKPGASNGLSYDQRISGKPISSSAGSFRDPSTQDFASRQGNYTSALMVRADLRERAADVGSERVHASGGGQRDQSDDQGILDQNPGLHRTRAGSEPSHRASTWCPSFDFFSP